MKCIPSSSFQARPRSFACLILPENEKKSLEIFIIDWAWADMEHWQIATVFNGILLSFLSMWNGLVQRYGNKYTFSNYTLLHHFRVDVSGDLKSVFISTKFMFTLISFRDYIFKSTLCSDSFLQINLWIFIRIIGAVVKTGFNPTPGYNVLQNTLRSTIFLCKILARAGHYANRAHLT